jgi:hypothetical protein
MFAEIEPLTLRTSLKSLHIRLYDEDRGKMIGYHPPMDPEALEMMGFQPHLEEAGAD